MRTKPLSFSQGRALGNLLLGLEIASHVRGAAASGGFGATIVSLRRAGLIDKSCNITEAGRAAHAAGRYDVKEVKNGKT